MEAEIQSYAAPPTLTSVPRLIEEHFASRGMSMSWQAGSPEQLSTSFSRGIRPVRLDDIDDPEVKAAAKEQIQVSDAGYLQKSDAVLCVQDEKSRREMLRYKEQLRNRRHDVRAQVDDLENELQKMLRSTGHHSGGPALVDAGIPISRVEDHAFVSKDLRGPRVKGE